MRGKLTPKQQRFCEEFIIDMNATQAAIRAGYSPKTANEQAARMLTITNLQRYLTELRSQQSERLQINADMVLRELAIIGFGSIGDVLEIDDSGARLKPQLTEEARAAIGSITITDDRIQVRMHNKIQALRELGLHFGLFNDFNTAIATLKQYGTVEATETGHVFIQCI
jgi:phage terminase small subunit